MKTLSPEEYEFRTRNGVLMHNPDNWKQELEKRLKVHIYNCVPCLRIQAGLPSGRNLPCRVSTQITEQLAVVNNAISAVQMKMKL